MGDNMDMQTENTNTKVLNKLLDVIEKNDDIELVLMRSSNSCKFVFEDKYPQDIYRPDLNQPLKIEYDVYDHVGTSYSIDVIVAPKKGLYDAIRLTRLMNSFKLENYLLDEIVECSYDFHPSNEFNKKDEMLLSLGYMKYTEKLGFFKESVSRELLFYNDDVLSNLRLKGFSDKIPRLCKNNPHIRYELPIKEQSCNLHVVLIVHPDKYINDEFSGLTDIKENLWHARRYLNQKQFCVGHIPLNELEKHKNKYAKMLK